MKKFCKSIVATLTVYLFITTSLTGFAYSVESNDTIKSTICFVSSSFDIIVPDDFPTIQQGVDSAGSGDRILVRAGIYKEHLIINKTGLTLVGVDKYNTILDGCKTTGQGVIVKAENAVIKNFTITNFKDHSREGFFSYDQAGIEVHKANTTITNNRFIENGVGIELCVNAFNTTMTDNEMINDGLFMGNYFYSYECFPNLTPKCFEHTIKNNTVNGKPLYYYRDQKDFTVPTDAGQITMVNCTNFTIKNLYMNNNDFSILLAFCHDSLIENNTITDTTGETLLFACENITIQNNVIADTFKAICLEYKSKNNIIQHNDLSGNYVSISLFNNASNNLIYKNKVYDSIGPMSSGIEVVSYHGGTQQNNNISENQIFNNLIGIRFRGKATNTTVYRNNITSNKFGMYLELSSDGNNIISNNFRKNIIQAFFNDCSKNCWENNYWGRPRVLPKIIFGIPFINIDRHPAKQPYYV